MVFTTVILNEIPEGIYLDYCIYHVVSPPVFFGPLTSGALLTLEELIHRDSKHLTWKHAFHRHTNQFRAHATNHLLY